MFINKTQQLTIFIKQNVSAYLFRCLDPNNLDAVVSEQLPVVGRIVAVVGVVAHKRFPRLAGQGKVAGHQVVGAKLDKYQSSDKEDTDEENDEQREDDPLQH